MGKRRGPKGPTGVKMITRNKRARFNYNIEDRYEAGVALQGSEVKSIRAGNISLNEAYASFDEHGELYLVDCHIAEYPWANRNNHEPKRPRKLLLHKRELARLSTKTTQDGYTLVPTAAYFKKGMIKVEIGVGKGKKLHDKRQTLKKRSARREIERALAER